ncbi:DNA polymerase III subunit delta' [Halodurantibacterium flavum]|uniref:DNA polymerase III subunit delta n=1 Tax=Halodurantibacterium flavum TaxID=1382802 RepID=A0ABW4S492_9RHOB
MSGADAPLPEPDRIEGAPHPRETTALLGQDAAEARFLDALRQGRLHHGWLLTGPRGVGKATLAWRIARALLAGSSGESLDVPPDHPVARRLLAQSEPGLFLLRRAWDADKKRLKTVITVDEVRRLKGFFNLSATEGGRRVVIVDTADEMNVNAANALLKALEEPPAGVTMLLVSHQPSRLLPTIRSRCRELRLTRLHPPEMAAALGAAGAETDDMAALAELADGSVGEAIRLTQLDGLATYRALIALFATLPRLDRPRALRLAETAAGRGAEPQLDLMLTLFDLFLSRLARTGVMGPPRTEAAPGEATLLARLAPDPAAGRVWADLHQALGARARHGRSVNLDPAALLLDMVLKVDETAARVTAPAQVGA